MVVVEPTHLININGSFPQVKGGNYQKSLIFVIFCGGNFFPENERISTENHWLENVFLIEMVPFQVTYQFSGVQRDV